MGKDELIAKVLRYEAERCLSCRRQAPILLVMEGGGEEWRLCSRCYRGEVPNG